MKVAKKNKWCEYNPRTCRNGRIRRNATTCQKPEPKIRSRKEKTGFRSGSRIGVGSGSYPDPVKPEQEEPERGNSSARRLLQGFISMTVQFISDPNASITITIIFCNKAMVGYRHKNYSCLKVYFKLKLFQKFRLSRRSLFATFDTAVERLGFCLMGRS